jgi:spoIIIJ-associated protein
MEWVETTGKTIEEAKELALEQLGVHEEDAEFELLDEPKQGLFGRVRGEARVRARVRPTPVRPKVDRRDRRRGERGERRGGAGKGAGRGASENPGGGRPTADGNANGNVSGNGKRSPRAGNTAAGKPPARKPSKPKVHDDKEQQVDARQVGEEAQRFLERLVAAFDLQGSVELQEDGDDLELRVQGSELGLLVGPRGTTLQAVQDLTRVASQRRLGDHDTRLRVDVGGYRERRRVALGRFALQMAEEVTASGVGRVLEPMSSADRKVIHDTLAEVDGISTRSEGDDPYRRVVITPGNG